MTINVRVRDGMCPDPTTGDGGATEGDIRGSFSDIIDLVGVKNLAGGHALVTQNSPAAMSILVAPGIVYIPNANYDELDSNTVKFWEAIITVSTTVTITANTSGSTRIDLICAKMDTAITPDEHASNIATLVAVAGTPGAGVPATPDNYAKLAEVEVANGASTIVTADITDSRVQAKINSDYIGASVSVTTKGDLQTYSTVPDRLPVGGNGQILSANSSKDTGLEWINGVTASSTTTFSNKTIDGDLNTVQDLPYSAIKGVAWTSFNPTIANLNVGTTGTLVGAYCQIGKTVFWRIKFVLGGTGISVGAISLTLPVSINAGYGSYTDIGHGSVFNGSTSYHLSIAGNGTFYAYKSDATYTTIAGCTSTVPLTWAAGHYCGMSGTYEAA